MYGCFVGRSDREGSNYENGQEAKVDIKTKCSNPGALSGARPRPEPGLLPPPSQLAGPRLSPVLAPKASMDHSPTSSKLYLPGSERGDEDSFTTKSIIKQPPATAEDKPAPIERVPPLPVVVFLSFYLIVGKNQNIGP